MPTHAALLATLYLVSGHSLSESELREVWDGFDGRCAQVLRRQVEAPYPKTGVWHYADFALAALYLNEKTDKANEAILRIHEEYPINPNRKRAPGDLEVQDFYWHINLLQRIYFLFHRGSEFFPGRLTPEAEAAFLDIFWNSARRHCKMAYANPERTWRIWGSENHGAMSWSRFWGTAHIRSRAPNYRECRYEDGSTPAQMAAAWDAFCKRYVWERASKGLLVEIGSTYSKYTLQGWYNMADFHSMCA